MRARRVTVVAVILVALLSSSPAGAGESLDACAQRVIRDWYSGGRVDKVYPLRCYRAAIRALPADVLQYSDADRDIARALAFARRGRADPGNGKDARAKASDTGASTTDATAPESAGTAVPKREPRPGAESPDGAAPVPRPTTSADDAVRLASGDEAAATGGGLPYPIIALAALAGILLSTAAVGWLTSRKR